MVPLEILLADPGKYRDQYIKLQAISYGGYSVPACYPYYGPPTYWRVGLDINSYWDEKSSIDITTFLGATILDPTTRKTVILWAWVRLYEGPLGCPQNDALGTPIPMEIKKIWYLETVHIQPIE